MEPLPAISSLKVPGGPEPAQDSMGDAAGEIGDPLGNHITPDDPAGDAYQQPREEGILEKGIPGQIGQKGTHLFLVALARPCLKPEPFMTFVKKWPIAFPMIPMTNLQKVSPLNIDNIEKSQKMSHLGRPGK